MRIDNNFSGLDIYMKCRRDVDQGLQPWGGDISNMKVLQLFMGVTEHRFSVYIMNCPKTEYTNSNMLSLHVEDWPPLPQPAELIA
jgi:hypothetical protein